MKLNRTKIVTCLGLIWVFICPISAQITGTTSAITSATMIQEVDGFFVESSVGQPFVQQWTGSNRIITEGFHQAMHSSLLEVELVVLINDCDQSFEVEIKNISGCQVDATYEIDWNNAAATRKTKGLSDFSTLRIVSSDGCVFQQSYMLSTMNPQRVPCDLRPYNYVSPNGDGKNDYFHIENIERPIYKNAKIVIFNRWGNLVWEGANYDNNVVKWSGEDKDGKPLPAGTYFFTIDVIGTTQNGYVELVK